MLQFGRRWLKALPEIKTPTKEIALPEDIGGRIGGVLKQGKWYEAEMLSYIRSLRMAGTYLDIGSNIGNHAVYFAVNTLASHVVAFEPTPDAIARLQAMIAINKLWAKVSIVPFACSDHSGEVDVVEGIYPSTITKRYTCETIDELVSAPVTVVKIDIEGAEPFALRGAVNTLRAFKPRLFVEVHDDNHMAEVMGVIGPIGYRATGKVWNPSPTYEFAAS